MDGRDNLDSRRRSRLPADRSQAENQLQRETTVNYQRPPIDAEEPSLLQGYLRTLSLRRWLVIAFALAGISLGLLTTFGQPPIY